MSLCCSFMFFFFKQKTAYEMRISDWSSDVCSSDLPICFLNLRQCAAPLASRTSEQRERRLVASVVQRPPLSALPETRHGNEVRVQSGSARHANPSGTRSEEHTSELQSLLRISYAVFCLKKKQSQIHMNN